MHLQKLELLNFKNYPEQALEFSPDINCLLGANGSGKTNLLDAVYYLSLTKSAFHTTDAHSIRHQEELMLIRGWFRREEATDIVQCSLQQGQRKLVMRNRKEYERLSEHVGRYPVVMIAPNDTDVIREGSEERRKFFDGILSQIDADYLQNLLRYNHALRQRNSLLKSFWEQGRVQHDLLEPFTLQLLQWGLPLLERRLAFLAEFLPLFAYHYRHLADGQEEVSIRYETNLNAGEADALMAQNLQRDLAQQRTRIGPHKDEYVFEIGGHPLKRYGSQGQQKSFLIALKLAQFDLLRDHKGFKPLLLLDDIFDKLDDKRMARLMELVSGHAFGQLFVTDARPERSARLFQGLADSEVAYFMIEEGRARQVDVQELLTEH
ncbi:DNA replication/repair protein RecF [Cesiribacter andamanensis]|uniref:DNA replication and repair protein RecF n=1 Tax=Cesiribacter andamanensis AMV16 TaxID=1279009 RepID=M7N2T5_9BACT|nr:DNA replication and repair protein RecF [Cesiribacter andamanensis]EMR02988.1 DNA replication and repair protein recF [Cesiribacter andamanensis AMV16]